MNKKMRVVLLEPEKEARVITIDGSLRGMQQTVGGNIEVIYACNDPNMCIIGHEEAKFEEDWKPTRALKTEDGQIYDLLAGKAFICAIDGENFVGLSDEQVISAMQQYKHPEMIVRTDFGYAAIPHREGMYVYRTDALSPEDMQAITILLGGVDESQEGLSEEIIME